MCHLVDKVGTYKSGVTWWTKLELIQVLVDKFATNKISLVTGSITCLWQFFTQIFACLKNLAGPQCQDLCIKYGRIFSISPVSANGQNDRDTIFHLLLEFPGIDIFIRKEYFSVLLHWDQGTVPRMM